MNQQDATDILCDAGKHLIKSRGLNPDRRMTELSDNPDDMACRIIGIALCEVHGASPHWMQELKRDIERLAKK